MQKGTEIDYPLVVVEVTEESAVKGKGAIDSSTNNRLPSTNATNPDNALFIVGDNLVDVPLGEEGGMDSEWVANEMADE